MTSSAFSYADFLSVVVMMFRIYEIIPSKKKYTHKITDLYRPVKLKFSFHQ